MSLLDSFAEIETRLNSAVVSRLSNATAQHAFGMPFGVIFDRKPADPFDGALDVSAYVCSFAMDSAPDIKPGDELLINGAPYTVSGPLHPDSSGWVMVTVFPKD